MIVKCPTCKNENATNAPGRLTRDINASLATIRQEARAAAFRDAIAAVMKHGEIIHRGNLIKRLEAAANSTKHSDGPTK